jgi:hypothetical protein
MSGVWTVDRTGPRSGSGSTSAASFRLVGIGALADPLKPAAAGTSAQQDHEKKRGQSKHEYPGMQQQAWFEIVEQVQHGITSDKFPPNLIQADQRSHRRTIDVPG